MNKIIILSTIAFLSACASNPKTGESPTSYEEELICPDSKMSTSGFKDTSACVLKVSIPTKFIKKDEMEKKWIKLGESKGLEFNFGINQGHYWVNIQEKESRVHPDSELILNIKSKGDSNVETITLVKVSTNKFQGFGFKRFGPSNFILIYKTPGQKDLLLDFDLDIN